MVLWLLNLSKLADENSKAFTMIQLTKCLTHLTRVGRMTKNLTASLTGSLKSSLEKRSLLSLSLSWHFFASEDLGRELSTSTAATLVAG